MYVLGADDCSEVFGVADTVCWEQWSVLSTGSVLER